MDQLRRIWKSIVDQLGKLTPSHKLLIGSLMVVVVMSLFLVAQYAGKQKMVPIVSAGTAEDQQKIAGFLDDRGIEYATVNGKIAVAVERQYAVLAQLAKGNALPADKKLLFPTLFDGQSWMRSRSEMDQRFTLALGYELAAVIRNFPGITDASVNISNPEPRGLGQSARKPTAMITVFTKPGGALDQQTVDALADLAAGSVAGLDAGEVKIVDGTTRRRYRANAAGDYSASTYLEQAAKVEERVQNKIAEHLAPFIPNVIVSVNAIIDASRKESTTESVLPKGEGTQSLPRREMTETKTSSDSSAAAEPGPASNVGMDVSRAGRDGKSTTMEEVGEVEHDNMFGHKTVKQFDPQGKPLKLNVSVSVPKDYIAAILMQKAGAPAAAGATTTTAAAPTDDEITKAWESERTRIEGMVRPLIETESAGGAAQASAGSLMVSLIPVAMAFPGGNAAGIGAVGGGLLGGSGGMGSVLENGLVKQIALGGLAAAALGLMLLMVRKAGKPAILPSAEELVGIPPALEPGSDLIGEADEGDTAMTGIEMDDNELKTSKMLEQVTELVKTNPTSAANVFSKWLAPEV